MNDLWSLFFTLQLVCYLQIYSIILPSNADLFVVEFIKIIEFEVLNPEGLIGIFVPGFKLKDLYNKKVKNSLNQK